MRMPELVEKIRRLCECEPAAFEKRVEDGAPIVVCTTCGASAISLSDGLPDFIKDKTAYQVSLQLTPALLKRFVNLLKEKTGLSTPVLMAKAKEGATVILKNQTPRHFYYELSDLVAAGLPVEVTPPYPHPLRPAKPEKPMP
jgi:hypothetical protein